jgi:hypothetical protein
MKSSAVFFESGRLVYKCTGKMFQKFSVMLGLPLFYNTFLKQAYCFINYPKRKGDLSWRDYLFSVCVICGAISMAEMLQICYLHADTAYSRYWR